MASHKLQITFDEATGQLTVTHRCAVEVGGHVVSHAEPVELANPAEAVAAIKSLIDQNRAEMGARTARLAVSHAAALAGKVPPGTKSLSAGGSLGAIGSTTPKG